MKDEKTRENNDFHKNVLASSIFFARQSLSSFYPMTQTVDRWAAVLSPIFSPAIHIVVLLVTRVSFQARCSPRAHPISAATRPSAQALTVIDFRFHEFSKKRVSRQAEEGENTKTKERDRERQQAQKRERERGREKERDIDTERDREKDRHRR